MRLIPFDLEIFPNLFLVVFYDPYIKEYKTFTLWEHDDTVKTNQIKELKAYLKEEQDTYFVGYNSLGYDMQILTEMLKMTGVSCFKLKEFNDRLINSEWPIYREEQLCNKTLDLMLINNFGPRSAKVTSLKKLEFNLRKKKIQDLPYHFNDIIDTATKVEEIIKYCKYDVEVTLDVFRLSKELIKMRIEFGDFNNIDLLNSTEPDIAKKYMLKLLAESTGKDENYIKKQKTYRDSIIVKDIILPYIKEYDWKNKELADALTFYNSVELYPTLKSNLCGNKLIGLKNTISKSIPYYDGKIDLGSGGTHFCTKSGVYNSNDDYIIVDWDKISYYPHFGMKHGAEPEHLKNEYCNFLNNTFTERKKYDKKKYPILNHSLKIILNSSFGS